jgi:hypothetical protein
MRMNRRDLMQATAVTVPTGFSGAAAESLRSIAPIAPTF